MKQLLYLFSIVCLLVSSCYKDNSNTEIEEINPIVIDFNTTNPSTSFSVFRFDTLQIKPIVYKEGLPDAKLKYEWHFSGNAVIPSVIDSTMTLCACISALPQANPYTLRFTVTDERGITKVMKFSVTVLSQLSEGLIVADTKDDVNSDLSLIIDRCFNYSIDKKKTKIYKNAYSDLNHEMVPGLVRDLQTANYGVNRSLTVLTDQTIIRADYCDFIKNEKESGAGMFMIPPKNLNEATFIVRDNYFRDEHMCVGGLIYTRGTQNNNRFYNFFRYPTGTPDYFVTQMYCSATSGQASIAFDQKNGKIMFVIGNNIYYGKDQANTDLFNVNNLKDYDCLHLGQINTSKMVMLARQKSSDNYMGLVMKPGGSTPEDNYATSVFDFTSATDITSAKYFDLNVLEETLYYATDTKLYSTPIANIAPQVQFTAAPGEKITNIKIWTSSGNIDYEDVSPENEDGYKTLGTNGRMMLVTTYNESTKEGKVIAIPIVTIGIGALEQNPQYHVVFGGYDRILKIAKQNS